MCVGGGKTDVTNKGKQKLPVNTNSVEIVSILENYSSG